MQIRLAVIQDKKELTRLIKEFENFTKFLSEKQRQIRAYKDLEKMAQETAEKYLSQPEYIVVVADENGVLKGFICDEIKMRKYRIYNKEGYVEKWFIERDYQDQGIGKELFNKLEEEFKKAECTHIGLDTHLENKKAIRIYEHMGFTKRLITFFKHLKDLP